MNLKRLARKFKESQQLWKGSALVSFSQVGEDLIVNYLFQSLQIKRPTYLDIGTNHPSRGNNTYFFYLRGSRGVCIEPDPELFSKIKNIRPGDLHINAGIGFEDKTSHADFYIFPEPYTGWNTFSKDDAEKKQLETGIPLKTTLRLQLLPVNEVLEKYFNPHPNFLSVDVEGIDLAILKTIDFKRFRPEVLCLESITFSLSRKEEKVAGIIQFAESQGYFVYADTHVNTIFCRQDIYNKTK